MTIIFNKGRQKDKQSSAGSIFFFLYKGHHLAFFVITFLSSQLFPSQVFSYPQFNQTSTLATKQSTNWKAVTGKEERHLPGYGIKKIGLNKDT